MGAVIPASGAGMYAVVTVLRLRGVNEALLSDLELLWLADPWGAEVQATTLAASPDDVIAAFTDYRGYADPDDERW